MLGYDVEVLRYAETASLRVKEKELELSSSLPWFMVY